MFSSSALPNQSELRALQVMLTLYYSSSLFLLSLFVRGFSDINIQEKKKGEKERGTLYHSRVGFKLYLDLKSSNILPGSGLGCSTRTHPNLNLRPGP